LSAAATLVSGIVLVGLFELHARSAPASDFGPNVGRLVKAKRNYDPDNVFCSAIPLPVSQHRLAAE
jgi:hypothetical protein